MAEHERSLEERRLEYEYAVNMHLGTVAIGTKIEMRLSYGNHWEPESTEAHDLGTGQVDTPVYQASLSKNFVAGYVLGRQSELTSGQQQALIRMLRISDNHAYRQLVDTIGAPEINIFMQDTLGLDQTRLAVRSDGTSFAGWTTAAESEIVFRYLFQQASQGNAVGQAVHEALRQPDSHYGVRPRMANVRIWNKTGTDFSTTRDEEVGCVAVAHDVGFVEGSDSFSYSITTASPSVSKAKKADRIMGNIGAEMARHVGGEPVSYVHVLAERAMRTVRYVVGR